LNCKILYKNILPNLFTKDDMFFYLSDKLRNNQNNLKKYNEQFQNQKQND